MFPVRLVLVSGRYEIVRETALKGAYLIFILPESSTLFT